MELYIYLSKKCYVDTWVNGGQIPIKPASEYRDQDRLGKFTPDENTQIEIKGKRVNPGMKKVIDSVINNTGGTLKINGNIKKGNEIIGENVNYKQWYEDGLILSFSTKCNKEIFDRFIDKESVI